MQRMIAKIIETLTAPDSDEPAGDGRFHRRCDGIARRVHGTFLYTMSGGVLLFGLWAGLTEVDQVTRGAGKVVPQSNNQIIQHLEGGIVSDIFVRNGDHVEKGEPLPVALYGTPFRRQIWRALLDIPPGATRTYGELAATAGCPRAARAVGAAVGANPISWFIPCHRALAADGRLHNYHWGVARKRAMLTFERAHAA